MCSLSKNDVANQEPPSAEVAERCGRNFRRGSGDEQDESTGVDDDGYLLLRVVSRTVSGFDPQSFVEVVFATVKFYDLCSF